MQFNGKVFAITGGASGIGLSTARAIVQHGGRVALFDLNAAGLEAAVKELGAEHAVAHVVDAAETQAVDSAVAQTVQHFGAVHGIVTCAGLRMDSVPITALEDEAWDKMMRVNLRSTFVSMRAIARAMIAQGTPGAIVSVAALSGQVARLHQSGYCASKAGVIHFCKCLALELAEHHIRVNAVCPGPVNTPFLDKARAQQGSQTMNDRIMGSLAHFRGGIPLRRIAEPEEVAQAVLFLLSEQAGHITGQILSIDGGETVH